MATGDNEQLTWMKHKNCGGIIREDWSKVYPYESDHGDVTNHPAYRCEKCGDEIVGDAQIELMP